MMKSKRATNGIALGRSRKFILQNFYGASTQAVHRGVCIVDTSLRDRESNQTTNLVGRMDICTGQCQHLGVARMVGFRESVDQGSVIFPSRISLPVGLPIFSSEK